MDWDYAIERNSEALRRVVAALVAMAGLAGAGSFFSPGGGGRPAPRLALERSEEACARPSLPRHLHRAVLRLLRPAEAAARRLVIAASRGLVVAPPRPRPPKQPHERSSKGGRRGPLTGIWMPPHLRPEAARAPRPLRACALPLFDPLPRTLGSKRRAAKGAPRICVPGLSAPSARPPERQSKGAPDDRLDAARLHGRLAALASALDDLPRAAKRFARWQAGRDAAGAQNRNRDAAGAQNENPDAEGARNESRDAAQGERGIGAGEMRSARPARPRRLWPLKPGRPSSVSRRAGFSRRSGPDLDGILKDVHSLALRALERADTS